MTKNTHSCFSFLYPLKTLTTTQTAPIKVNAKLALATMSHVFALKANLKFGSVESLHISNSLLLENTALIPKAKGIDYSSQKNSQMISHIPIKVSALYFRRAIMTRLVTT